MAQLLKDIPVGSIVKIKENGVAQNYIIVNQGLPSSIYDSSCNGTWLLKQNYWSNSTWNPWGDTSNDFQNNSPFQLLNNNFLNVLDSNIKSTILNVKIPYKPYYNSSVSTGSNGYSCKAFLLSGYEMGITTIINQSGEGSNPLPQDGAILSYFQGTSPSSSDEKRAIGKDYWTRSLGSNTSNVFIVTSPGGVYTRTADLGSYIRPALVMPSDILVDSSNNITSYSIPAVSFSSVPSLGMVNQTITIKWSSISVSGFTINYQLQRNVNNGGWQNVGSPSSQTSYTDTAQSGWTQVQYQVAPVVEGVAGDYTQSSIIPVSDPAVLVISGSDGNLGTLTSNVPYTVSSNTGNQISLTRTVNGAQVVTLTVDSSVAYSIPVADLPTGTGTIQITASVENTSQQIQTATRTWTYYKTPIDIPSTGGIAQLTQNGQNIWPVTVPDAVEAPVYLGGNLNAALNKLGQAALYVKIGQPKYNEVKVDLSKVSVGDEVLLNENGKAIPYIVVQIGKPSSSLYDNSCDGVWLLRKNCDDTIVHWNSSGATTLSGSDLVNALNSYIDNYDEDVKSQIKTVKIPYCIGGGNSTVRSGSSGLSCQVFALGCQEIGYSESLTVPQDGVLLNYFSDLAQQKRISNQSWWTRTPNIYFTDKVFSVGQDGEVANGNANGNAFIRPTIIMPNTFTVTYYVDAGNNIYPSQEYTQGGSITDVFGYDIPIAQSESGTYVGTGTYGVGNQTSISLSFTPKFICITNQTDSSKRAFLPYGGYGVCWTQSTISSSSISAYGLSTTWTQTGISWYNSSSAVQQMNESGDTYQYTAFG